jgi:putative ABC transport system permease protein
LQKEMSISANHVIVIGPDLATTLFGHYVDPINKTIRLKNVSFRVVGVLAKGGGWSVWRRPGNIALIPMSIAQRHFLGILLLQHDPSPRRPPV